MSTLVTKKIRCLVVGCNPRMTARGEEGTSVSTWVGDENFKKHSLEHPNHRVAKAPERSKEGKMKQEIRNKTGIYPTDLTEYNRKKDLEEEAAQKRAEEKRREKITNKETEAKRKKDAELRRKNNEIKRAKELQKVKESNLRLIEKTTWLNLDEGFILEFKENVNKGIELLNEVKMLIDYGNKKSLENESNNKAFSSILEVNLKSLRWNEAVIRRTYEEQGFYTDEEITHRSKLIKQWEELTRRGEREGWLTWTNDYAGSELVANTTTLHPTRKNRRSENAAAYSERLKDIIIEIHKNIKDEFEEIENARFILESYGLND